MDAPYFIIPAVEALKKGNLPEEESSRLRRLVAANVGDFHALRLMLGLDPAEFARFYPDLKDPELTTVQTIDSFLDNFGNNNSPTPPAAAEIPRKVTDAWATASAPDIEPLEPESTAADADPTRRLLDSFLSANPAKAPSRAKQKKEALPPLKQATELIKKKHYKEALDIIQQLSLNNPQKSIYFADQIRFLKKLIFNESRRKATHAANQEPGNPQ